jgi:Asp-tRNA(Asn)/Glu-tRNA(Gln) amidotransferase B subunit
LAEEPCQCSDCQRFYKEHDRLIREFPTFKQQQELNWASIQSFRTLCTKITYELQRELSERESNEDISPEDKHISETEITEALDEIEGVNAYLYSIEALMERIFETKISNNIESKFKEIAKELAPDPLNMDRLILNRLFHQTPDSPDKKNIN